MPATPRPPTAADLVAARAVAVRFLDAVKAGDEPAARALLHVREGETIDFRTMHESTGAYTLGPAEADGANVVTVATITAAPGRDAPPSLPVVLSRPDGTWKVDMGASMNRLLGVDLEGMVKQMAEGLGAALSQGFDAMGQALAGLGTGEGAAPAEEAATADGAATADDGAAPRAAGARKGGKASRKRGTP
ncbi:MAG: hypothetical protein U1E39_19190 [Planctomycetota bacterium]